MIALVILAGIFLCGLVVLVVEIRRAPEAYEDQSGFHFASQNHHPEGPGLFCGESVPRESKRPEYGNEATTMASLHACDSLSNAASR